MQLTKYFVLLPILLLISNKAISQISPRSSSVPRGNSTASTQAPVSLPTAANMPAEYVSEVADTKVILKRVEGSASDQTVTLHFLLTNHKANTDTHIGGAQAVDTEGDAYNYYNTPMPEYKVDPLFTEAMTKAYCNLGRVPSSVKTFQVLKINLWRADRGSTPVEFRNVAISWK
ncbi:hypothetical protein SD10_20760 [Spirosoma radiotolerans]|uniref:Uncharacterized protein n=2 Tax=Spirosoma radiotolerans TaxID=1379870 RepID=A0A0E3ZYG2_9BACT|nr:hypothetical protein SD10_20760 [Spirosoma radiotolerans]